MRCVLFTLLVAVSAVHINFDLADADDSSALTPSDTIVYSGHNHTRPQNNTRYPTPVPSPTPTPLPPRGDMTKCPNECSGHGIACIPQPSGQGACLCHAGFSGFDCHVWNGCNDRNFCSGHGSCVCQTTSCKCECLAGWDGPDCSKSLPSHCPNHCSGRGVCQPGEKGGYGCVCDTGYEGVDCGKVKAAQCVSECSGQGSCDMDVSVCGCVASSGLSCNTAVDACGGCIHGTCNGQSCECSEGYSGKRCDVYLQANDPCGTLGFCSGRGVCFEGTNSLLSCVCQEGFDGTTCNQLLASVSDICPNYCSGHGTCDELSKACVCADGYGGADCSVPPCPADDKGVVCNAHGVCMLNSSQVYSCVCDDCFSGSLCEVNAVEQCQGLCGGNGDCVCSTSQGVSDAVCACHDGWEGPMCDIRSITGNAPECCPLECSGNGNCEACACQCFDGFTGADCATSTTPPMVIAPPEGADALDDLSQLLEFSEGLDASVTQAKKASVVDVEKYSMSHLWD